MKTKANPDMDILKRGFIVKCLTNRGGKHLIPVTVQEIVETPDDPDMDYRCIGKESVFFGEIRHTLERRGDLVKTASGDLRVTRTPHVGKTVRPGRGGYTFVQFTVRVPEWCLFTKRTKGLKLAWLKREMNKAGLRWMQYGRSLHAPRTFVHRDDIDAAWQILEPVDHMDDNARRFA